ncbi:MAG: hypothetical protein VW999_10295 [Alphaproteobacteria bacterium]
MTVRQSPKDHLRRVYLSVGSALFYVLGPSIVFAVIWILRGGNALNANFFLASALMFAVVAAALDQMAIGLAEDRYDRSGPSSERDRVFARLWAWVGIVFGASLFVVLVAAVMSSMSLPIGGWARLLFSLILGAVSIGIGAVALSFWIAPEQIRRWSKIASFVLILGAGLIVPPFMLPALLWQVANILPTRHYADIVWASGFGWPWPWVPTLWLGLFTAGFILAVIVGKDRAARQDRRSIAPADGLP